ncbi:MAG: ankyrin repeat domain-containing protein [Endomicrobia bacterium]|nr:ankyrin repeat domain-containing protein [Endomicrobiia bacterium]
MLKKILAVLSFIIAVIAAAVSYIVLKNIYIGVLNFFVMMFGYSHVVSEINQFIIVSAVIAAAIVLSFIYLGILFLRKKSSRKQFIEAAILIVLLLAAGVVSLNKMYFPAAADIRKTIKAETGMTPLMIAVSQGDGKIELTKRILKREKTDINAKNTAGWSALFIASFGYPKTLPKRLETLKLLIASGADVNLVDNDGRTPLMLASPEAAEILVQSGADINAKDEFGMTVLMHAAMKGDDYIELIKRILEQGEKADVNATAMSGGLSALDLAVSRGIASENPKKLETVKLLIASGADVNAKTASQNITPLLFAASNKAEIVKVLIDAGANVNARDSKGITPLMKAASENADVNVIQLLIKSGADVKAKDNEGKTVYDWLAKNDKMPQADKETAKNLLTIQPLNKQKKTS